MALGSWQTTLKGLLVSYWLVYGSEWVVTATFLGYVRVQLGGWGRQNPGYTSVIGVENIVIRLLYKVKSRKHKRDVKTQMKILTSSSHKALI
jgi:hypothetical protein